MPRQKQRPSAAPGTYWTCRTNLAFRLSRDNPRGRKKLEPMWIAQSDGPFALMDCLLPDHWNRFNGIPFTRNEQKSQIMVLVDGDDAGGDEIGFYGILHLHADIRCAQVRDQVSGIDNVAIRDNQTMLQVMRDQDT